MFDFLVVFSVLASPGLSPNPYDSLANFAPASQRHSRTRVGLKGGKNVQKFRTGPLLSPLFCPTRRGYLVSNVVNTTSGPPESKILLTGERGVWLFVLLHKSPVRGSRFNLCSQSENAEARGTDRRGYGIDSRAVVLFSPKEANVSGRPSLLSTRDESCGINTREFSF